MPGANPWVEHVKNYAAAHGIKYGEALKLAGATYKPVAGASKAAPKKPKTGCHMGKKGRCVAYTGADADGCSKGDNGRCRKTPKEKKKATSAQKRALEKARAAKAAKKAKQSGGYWW